MPGTVLAIALATMFGVARPLAGRFVLVGTLAILPLAYFVRSLPLTGRALLAGFRQLDPALEEAAQSLGAGRWRRLWRVTLPALRPALAAGASLAFVTALGRLRDVGAALHLRDAPHLDRDPLEPAPLATSAWRRRSASC